ncbi:MAG: GMC family oxidoreductase, partial [Polyangiales bacterium]
SLPTVPSLPVLQVQQPADMPERGLKLEADVVVIGSGASGAVAAYELSKAGAKVVVLEAGPYVKSEQFTERLIESFQTLYAEGGNQTNTSGDLVVLQGACIGGSTVVNAAVCFRTPDAVLRAWGENYGLDNLSPEVMAPYFDKVEKNLHIHPNGPHEINLNGRLIWDGAKKVGIPGGPASRNIEQCALTGHCIAGCKTDRKQSMLVTYLPWASELGATILSGTRADSFEVSNGRITRVNAVATEPNGRSKPVTVQAGLVVVAAGAVQTPLLFQRNAIGNSSGLIGHNFACHPSTAIIGEHKDDVYAWRGATITTYAGNIEDPKEGSYLLEAGGLGPMSNTTASEGGVGREYVDFIENSKKFLASVTLIHDHNVGHVYMENGRKRIDYDLDDRDFRSMQEAFRGAAKIYFAAGAERVFLPTTRRTVIESPDQIDSVINSLQNGKHRYKLTSYHPQGTMRMGKDPKLSVVGPDGRMHDLDNVYVIDASLFPTTLLVNPQETVYAMASYFADRTLSRG